MYEEQRTAVAAGLAYRAILLTYLADDLRMNVNKAVQRKQAVNAKRYPLELRAGLGTQYHALQD
jgi:hypothetical protein